MTHANVVANELSGNGFQTEVISNTVMVSLKNRKPSRMEVETALENIFDGIEFNCKSISNAVMVTF